MEIRPYQAADREACLAIFDSNFADRDAFAAFLDAPNCAYLVMEHDGQAVGCGGYYLRDEHNARLVWGMIRRDLQRRGLGRFLLLYRLKEIGKLGKVERVSLSTDASAARFFESQGFKVLTSNGGQIEMSMKLTVCPAL